MDLLSSKFTSVAAPGGTKPAGLEVEYNHDLDVSEAFLSAYESIREALKDQRLLDAFNYFDGKAKAHKRSFQLLGADAGKYKAPSSTHTIDKRKKHE